MKLPIPPVSRSRRFVSYSLAEKFETLHALLAVPLLEIGLRSMSIQSVARLAGVQIGAGRGHSEPPAAPSIFLESKSRSVQRALRFWGIPNTCLRRSLTLGALLNRHRPVLRFGASEADGQLQNHAWLELMDGSVCPAQAELEWRSLGSVRPKA